MLSSEVGEGCQRVTAEASTLTSSSGATPASFVGVIIENRFHQ